MFDRKHESRDFFPPGKGMDVATPIGVGGDICVCVAVGNVRGPSHGRKERYVFLCGKVFGASSAGNGDDSSIFSR